MYKRIPIKNHVFEIRLTARRTLCALWLIFFLIAFLITRLVFLQIYKNEVYSTASINNWLELIPIEPTRGLIFDRNGILLAENIPVFSLDVLPYKVQNLTETIAAIGKIVSLSESDINQFKKQLKQRRRFEEIPLKLRLSDEEVARFAENQHAYPGFFIKARLMRHYPFGEIFSHVLGYVGRINAQELNEIDQVNYSANHYIGKFGIEKYYEEELHGRVGYEQVENDASGKPIRILKEIKATPGNNLYLTLDSNLQFAAVKALNGRRGAIVVIQPATGQILALVSQPAYDPNLFVLGISQKDYHQLQHALDKPLYNRAVRGLYPPASTVKPFLAIGALNEGITTLDFSLFDPGWFQLHDNSHLFHDWRKQGHGIVNISKAIVSSCDVFFYDLAIKMGIKRMDNILAKFGFGESSGVDLDDDLPGVLASPEWKFKSKRTHWYEGDTILSGIGQGYMQSTPLQLAAATATLANRGQRFTPYLMLNEQMPDKTIQMQAPILLDTIELKDNQIWNAIIKVMQEVVDDIQGTAHPFGKHPTYTIAAKTGTSQVSRRRNPEEEDQQEKLPEKLRDHHLFIAFAPVDKPQIAVAVVTENSNTATDTARVLFNYYFGKMRYVTR